MIADVCLYVAEGRGEKGANFRNPAGLFGRDHRSRCPADAVFLGCLRATASKNDQHQKSFIKPLVLPDQPSATAAFFFDVGACNQRV